MEIDKIINLVANLATTSMVGFAAYQCVILKKDYKLKNEKEERAKAIELSKFYADNLINNINYLFYIFSESGIDTKLKHLKFTQLKEFDQQELFDLIEENSLREIKTKLNNIDPDILAKANLSFVGKYSKESIVEHSTFLSLESEAQVAADSIKKTHKPTSSNVVFHLKYYTEFNNIMVSTLNSLEYFCMSFNNGIADEETIYQSLHQSFLGIVKLLYFKIADINLTGKDKYYTNIISLFNKWAARHAHQEKTELEYKRKIPHKKDKIKK